MQKNVQNVTKSIMFSRGKYKVASIVFFVSRGFRLYLVSLWQYRHCNSAWQLLRFCQCQLSMCERVAGESGYKFLPKLDGGSGFLEALRKHPEKYPTLVEAHRFHPNTVESGGGDFSPGDLGRSVWLCIPKFSESRVA